MKQSTIIILLVVVIVIMLFYFKPSLNSVTSLITNAPNPDLVNACNILVTYAESKKNSSEWNQADSYKAALSAAKTNSDYQTVLNTVLSQFNVNARSGLNGLLAPYNSPTDWNNTYQTCLSNPNATTATAVVNGLNYIYQEGEDDKKNGTANNWITGAEDVGTAVVSILALL